MKARSVSALWLLAALVAVIVAPAALRRMDATAVAGRGFACEADHYRVGALGTWIARGDK